MSAFTRRCALLVVVAPILSIAIAGRSTPRTRSERLVVRTWKKLGRRICEEFACETGGPWCYTATFGGG